MFVRLPSQGFASVTGLIERYDAHAEWEEALPVRQIALREGWEVVKDVLPLAMHGFAVVKEPVRVMWVNADDSLVWRRYTIAHEMMHVLLDHHLGVDALLRSSMQHLATWIHQRQEHEANLAAAYFLIPDWLLAQGWTEEEVACRCMVPVDAVRMRVMGACLGPVRSTRDEYLHASG